MTRLFILVGIIGAAIFGTMQLSAQASANGWQTYDAGEFMMAQKKGKTIVVDVYADWCPTCRAQAPIMEELRKEKQNGNTLFVKVNFDDEKAFLRAHRIPRQSTILVFNGETEVVRSIAETNRTRLRAKVLGAL
ncbi:thioredoxin family protein [Erythrobacter sp. F6033]|uniref:thioredoxin family protein n=1 Tax=Erythrobacter sp. F6033 TaxID=2926401 RepID=UPI001FF3BCC4|nr:thioredoxin family protein [Erythrobacter sp. F6033]MCK0127808.1 thioredoxin family protein [Erythrobacter sp. F6033]